MVGVSHVDRSHPPRRRARPGPGALPRALGAQPRRNSGRPSERLKRATTTPRGYIASSSATTTGSSGRCPCGSRSSTWRASPAASRRCGASARDQSSGLAFRGADGRAYTFRGAREGRDARARPGAPADDRRADRAGSDRPRCTPRAPVVAAPLLEAAGVLHVEPRLVVMPDDARARRVPRRLRGRARDDPGVPARRRGGRARVRRRDRDHRRRRSSSSGCGRRPRAGRLARVPPRAAHGPVPRRLGPAPRPVALGEDPGRAGWQPIPEDCDFAFCRFDGLVLLGRAELVSALGDVRRGVPGHARAHLAGLAARPELLSDLERPAWEEIAADLQRAAHRRRDRRGRPPPARGVPARGRRAAREGAAATARPARAGGGPVLPPPRPRRSASTAPTSRTSRRWSRSTGGDLEVRVSRADAAGAPVGEPWFRRRFRARETREIRHRPARRRRSVRRARAIPHPRARRRGRGRRRPRRLARGGGARLADWQGANRVCAGAGTTLDARPYTPPPLESETPYIPARDWGRQTDLAALVRGEPGPRRLPRRRRAARAVRVPDPPVPAAARSSAPATRPAPAGSSADYDGELRRENSPRALHALRARIADRDPPLLRVRQRDARASERVVLRGAADASSRSRPLVVPLAPRLDAVARARARAAPPGRRPPRPLHRPDAPYGSEPFGQLGARGRAPPRHPRRRRAQRRAACSSPQAARSTPPRGTWSSRSATSTRKRRLTSPARSAAPDARAARRRRRVLGTYPFHEAAFVGGRTRCAGSASQRFAGDAAAYGSAELRLALGRYFFVLPGEYGRLRARRHRAGCGSTASTRTAGTPASAAASGSPTSKRRNTVTVAAARSAEGTGLLRPDGVPLLNRAAPTARRGRPRPRCCGSSAAWSPGSRRPSLLLLANLFVLLVAYYVLKTVREPLILDGRRRRDEVVRGGVPGGAARRVRARLRLAVLARGPRPAHRRRGPVLRATVELFYLGSLARCRTSASPSTCGSGSSASRAIALFWSYANDLHGPEAGERLFPVIAIGAALGSPVGSKLAERLFESGVSPFQCCTSARRCSSSTSRSTASSSGGSARGAPRAKRAAARRAGRAGSRWSCAARTCASSRRCSCS